MLKEYRFEKYEDRVTGKHNSIVDTKTYYKVNEHWVNVVVYQLLYDRAIEKGFKHSSDGFEHRVYENGKYYKAESFEYNVVLSKERNI